MGSSDVGTLEQTRYATFTSRFRALLIDTALVAGASIIVLFLGQAAQRIPGSGPTTWILIVMLLFLYEPFFIWRRGATIGHSLKGIQVVSADTGKRPGFLRALVRHLIKTFLGIFSFFTMALSRRHQAIHDIVTRTSVQLAASTEASESEYHVERIEREDVVLPSPIRRIVIVAVYLVAVFIAYGIALVSVDKTNCAEFHSCTGIIPFLVNGLSVLWLALSLGVIVAGWKGLLFGARRGRQIDSVPLVA